MLRLEVVKKSCVFVLNIVDPLETLKKLSMFFQDRGIIMESLHMHRYRNDEANVIIHCQVEKDRIRRTVELMEQLPGLLELDKMEGK